jgi:hypothetical protein
MFNRTAVLLTDDRLPISRCEMSLTYFFSWMLFLTYRELKKSMWLWSDSVMTNCSHCARSSHRDCNDRGKCKYCIELVTENHSNFPEKLPISEGTHYIEKHCIKKNRHLIIWRSLSVA